MARPKTEQRKTIEHVKRQAGLRRRDHFEAGGSVIDWRGQHTVVPDKKKEKSRTLCRQKINSEE